MACPELNAADTAAQAPTARSACGLDVRVLDAMQPGFAYLADELARHVGASRDDTIRALHRLQDRDDVYLRNGFYRLSVAAANRRFG